MKNALFTMVFVVLAFMLGYLAGAKFPTIHIATTPPPMQQPMGVPAAGVLQPGSLRDAATSQPTNDTGPASTSAEVPRRTDGVPPSATPGFAPPALNPFQSR
jgi:hypothetical protein